MIKILLSARLGEKRVNQTELAKMVNVRPNTVNDLYHNLADRVSLETLDLICEYLEIPLSALLEWTPNKEPKLDFTISKVPRKK